MPIVENVVYGPPEINIPAHLNFGAHIIDRLKEGGHRIAQICAQTHASVTYYEILQRSVNFASALHNMGIKKGDVVCLSSENRFEFTTAALGIICSGATIATLNILYSEDELKHLLQMFKPKVIVSSEYSFANLLALTKSMKCVKKFIQFGDELLDDGIILYNTLVTKNYDVDNFLVEDVDGMHDTLALMCSSGTTGLPKGVELTHVNFLVETFHFHYYFSPNSGIVLEDLNTMLCVAPWFHPLGFIVHFIMISLNVTSCFMVKFDENVYLSALEKYKVGLSVIVPPVALLLAKHPAVDKYDLSNLKMILCGAAPLSSELQQSVSKRLSSTAIAQGYGCTEMTMANMIDISRGKKFGSCGCLSPGVRAKIVDLETRKKLGPHQAGELCLKGPLRMKGYLHNPAATKELEDEEGFLRTGDIGYYDEDGYFYIVDRLKELIKYNGFQVAPAELEACLLQHPAVADCGVVGKPDEAAGELPTAFVVRKSGADVTRKQLIDFVAKKMSSIKQLRGGVIFTEAIPKNLSGKILRRELRLKLVSNKI